jgi:hypothetical protein
MNLIAVCNVVGVLLQKLSVATMAMGTFLFCLFWQFNQFIMLLQAFALFGVWILDILPASKVTVECWSQTVEFTPCRPPPFGLARFSVKQKACVFMFSGKDGVFR